MHEVVEFVQTTLVTRMSRSRTTLNLDDALKEARKELSRLEREVAKLASSEAALHAQLALHATDFGRIAALDAQLRGVVAERETAEEAWLKLAGA